jgi:hypothetical protein
MNTKQMTRYSTNERALHFLNDHDEELSGIVLYVPIKAAFEAGMLKLNAAQVKQAKQIAPVTQNKKRMRLVMAETMVKFLDRAAVQCHNNGEFSLGKAFTKGITYFTVGKYSEAPDKARNLKDLICENHENLTVISDDDITEMETAISQFEAVQNNPKLEIIDRKATATKMIPKVLNELDTLKDQMGKIIYSYLPHLAHGWEETIKVGHSTAIRHVSLVIKIEDSVVKVPLPKVKCTVSHGKDTHVKYSTRLGSVRFKGLQENIWDITLEHSDYHTEFCERIATFEKKITRLHIPLKKISETIS